MPTYDFACDSCGEIEIHHSIHEDHPGNCPNCGAPIERVMRSIAPFKFVGGRGNADGWRKERMDIQAPTSKETGVPYR